MAGPAYSPDERWDTLATEVGEAVHQICPRWALVVEGVGHCADDEAAGCHALAAVGQDTSLATWWGENLQAAGRLPVRVPHAPNKVLYSPHVYGPSVASQPYFDSAAFPSNLRAIWHQQWGHLVSGPSASDTTAVLIGEWGGRLASSDKETIWQHELAKFIADPGSRLAGSFYWCLGPGAACSGSRSATPSTQQPVRVTVRGSRPRSCPSPSSPVPPSPVSLPPVSLPLLPFPSRPCPFPTPRS